MPSAESIVYSTLPLSLSLSLSLPPRPPSPSLSICVQILNHVGVGENESGKGPTRDDGATRGVGRREGGSEASAMVAILTADEGGERRTGKRREREREREREKGA